MATNGFRRSLAIVLVLLGLAACSEPESDAGPPDAAEPVAARPVAAQPVSGESVTAADLPRGKGFDFYVLALSWSPTYCLGEADGNDGGAQCATGRKLGFVVHGLWPQNEHGYPEYCPPIGSDRVEERLGRTMLDLVPSMGLLGHLWRKHGSCTGLSQSDFFTVLRSARDRVAIPDSFASPPESISAKAAEDAFITANPGLSAGAIAPVCRQGRLQEMRICLTHALEFRACREVDAAGCRAGSLSVPPPR